MSSTIGMLGVTEAGIGTVTLTVNPLFLVVGAVLTTLVVVIIVLRATAKRKNVL